MCVLELRIPIPVTLPVEEQVERFFNEAIFLEANPAIEKIHGVPLDQLIGDSFKNHVPVDDGTIKQFIANGYELKNYQAQYPGDGSGPVWISSNIKGVVVDGHLTRVFSVHRDITETVQVNEKLNYQANYDELTGLPNRQHLLAKLKQSLTGIENSGRGLGLLLMDLDGFKEINDALGHDMGDQLLRQLGRRMIATLDKETEFIARLGGDEFAVIVENTSKLDAVKAVADKIHGEIRKPFEHRGYRLEVGVSMGIAVAPEHGKDCSSLLRCADVAMYSAKKNGQLVEVYDISVDQHSPRRLLLLTQLGEAITNDELVLYYQPKIELASGACVGYEALIRWQHPVFGLIMPVEFIPLAEVSDLIRPLSLWVIEAALKQIKVWQQQGQKKNVSINISVRNLLDSELCEQVQKLCKQYAVLPGQLEFEITESALISDPDRVRETLLAFSLLGIHLSIDDYGTGYSSLAYIKQLPVDTLKIDRTFVQHMLEHQEDSIIVKSTINLAHNLGLQVVAEGIEEQAVASALQAMQCDYAQGYFFGKPVPAEQLER
jgi:diguanylate cyclase (GGDEF)-like protein/PAS domain S-box-containing protein